MEVQYEKRLEDYIFRACRPFPCQLATPHDLCSFEAMAEVASGPFCHICSCALDNPPDSTGICMCDPTSACATKTSACVTPYAGLEEVPAPVVSDIDRLEFNLDLLYREEIEGESALSIAKNSRAPMAPMDAPRSPQSPRLRASTEAMRSPTRSSSIKEPIVDATARMQLVSVLLPTASFTQEYVNAAFGFDVKEIKFQKLTKLHRLWHYILDNGIAAFGIDGPVNIWGFHSVHVLDRQGWNACMLALGFNMARGRGGMPAQRPKQAIYEIIKYCGMKAVRGQGTQQPRVDKKALEQDNYMFDSAIFDRNKHRARGW